MLGRVSQDLPDDRMTVRQHIPLQPGAVNELVIHSKLTAGIANYQDAYTATAVLEGALQATEEVALIQDWQALFDVTGLGHGHDLAVVRNVEHAVLLEDGAEHVLDDDGRGGV